VTEEEIIDFARRYDPQPFHLDHEAAKASHFGGLVASGWMTSAVLMRLMCDHFIPRQSSMGSPGWTRCAGSSRCGRATPCARVSRWPTRPSQSKPDRGVVIRCRHQVLNQDGEVVMTMRGMGMYRRRPAA
jgi:acyl dehydratase